MAEASRAHDTTAQRMSVAAYDRSVREAAGKPKRNSIIEAIAAAGKGDDQ
jgi:hypothetical protein